MKTSNIWMWWQNRQSGSSPENTSLPEITGAMGIGSTLTASTGTWSGVPVSYTYQWKRDGVNISLATNSTYDQTINDDGSVITVTVTATNDYGSTPATSLGFNVTVFTTLDGFRVALNIGDSKAAGTSTAVGMTLAAGVMKQWKRDTEEIVDVTSGDVLYINSTGSWHPQYGSEYNSLTGKKIILVNSGSGNSTFYRADGSNTWYTNGTLYSDAIDRAVLCVAEAGLQKVYVVNVVLAINDYNLGTTDITAYAASLIDRLNTDLDSPKIHISIMHQTNNMTTATASLFKKILMDLETTYSNVHIDVNEATLFANGYTNDNIHWNENGNIAFGKMRARYLASAETNKSIRRVCNSTFINELSADKKTAFTNLINSSEWPKLTMLQIYKGAGSQLNANADVLGRFAPYPVNSPTWSDAAGYSFNGTNQYLRSQINTSTELNYGESLNNGCIGVGTGTVTTAPGTLACVIGVSDGSGRQYIRQLATNRVAWSYNTNVEIEYTTDTGILSDTDYYTDRSASNDMDFGKNGSDVQSQTTGSVAIPNGEIFVGCRSAAGVPMDYINAQVKYCFHGEESLNKSNLVTLINAIVAAV